MLSANSEIIDAPPRPLLDPTGDDDFIRQCAPRRRPHGGGREARCGVRAYRLAGLSLPVAVYAPGRSGTTVAAASSPLPDPPTIAAAILPATVAAAAFTGSLAKCA
jgi:hypothetical protein